jgi:hypothetical protein
MANGNHLPTFRVGYFLEDIAHEKFITALVRHIAEKMGVSSETLDFVIYNASGGKGKVMTELRRFLRDVQRGRISSTPVLVVTIDGNCQGYTEKYNEITQLAAKYEHAGNLVCAIPDPHIERWYIADPAGLQKALDASTQPELPSYKCERARYKQAIRDVFANVGIRPLLGGVEYGDAVVNAMDLYTAQQADPALKHFVENLQAALSPFARRISQTSNGGTNA